MVAPASSIPNGALLADGNVDAELNFSALTSANEDDAAAMSANASLVPIAPAENDFGMSSNDVDDGSGGEGDIIVTGRRYYPNNYDPDPFSAGGGGSGPSGSGGDGSYEPTSSNPPSVSIFVTDFHTPEEEQEILQAHEKMAQKINELTSKIMDLSDSAQIPLADGRMISGAALKALWNGIDFVITDRVYQSGYGGQYDADTSISYFNYSSALDWSAHANGLDFILMHEVVHSTPQGQEVLAQQWSNYLARGGSAGDWSLSPEFSENEEYAYYGARAMARSLGIADFSSPFDHGYEYGDLTR